MSNLSIVETFSFSCLIRDRVADVRIINKTHFATVDLVMVMSGKSRDDSAKLIRNLSNERFPRERLSYASLPGKGNARVCLVDLKNAIKLIMVLPGKTATAIRDTMAEFIYHSFKDQFQHTSLVTLMNDPVSPDQVPPCSPAAAGSSSQAYITAIPCPESFSDLMRQIDRNNELTMHLKQQKSILTEQETELNQQETKLNAQKTEHDQREAKLMEQETKLNAQKTEHDQREAKLMEQETKLNAQKTKQEQQGTKLNEKKTDLNQQEVRLTKQKTDQSQREAKLVEQKAALDQREAEMGQQVMAEPDDNALQAKKRNRETDLEFLVKTATSIAQVEWLADDEMKQDIKAKIRKLTNPE